MNLWASLLIISSLSFLNPTAWANGAHGVFRVVKGQVEVKSSQSGIVSKARIGSKVLPGDVIKAGKDSRAKVVMVDNNEINISPDTQIKIEKYEYDPGSNKKDVLLNVIYGKVRSKVEQKYDGRTSKFQVKTPSAVAGVRGTNFLTSYSTETGESQVVTFEGKVEFGKPGPGGQIMDSVQVTPGTMAEVGKGGAPPIQRPVPASEMKKMDKETNAETAGASSSGESKSASSGDQKPTDKKEASADKKDSGSKSQGSAKNEPKSGEQKQPGKADGKSSGNQAGSNGKSAPSGSANTNAKTAGGNNGSSGANSRTPASVGPNGGSQAGTAGGSGNAGPNSGGSMIGDSDLAGGPGNQDFGQGAGPKVPGAIFDQIAPPIEIPTQREIVEDATPATLKIIINQQ